MCVCECVTSCGREKEKNADKKRKRENETDINSKLNAQHGANVFHYTRPPEVPPPPTPIHPSPTKEIHRNSHTQRHPYKTAKKSAQTFVDLLDMNGMLEVLHVLLV